MTNEEAIHRLESHTQYKLNDKDLVALNIAMDALKQESRWIPVSERLPESPYGCLVTVMDTNPMTCDEFENIYPSFVGWDGENWNDADGNSIPFEVVAWQPLPEPHKTEREVDKNAH